MRITSARQSEISHSVVGFATTLDVTKTESAHPLEHECRALVVQSLTKKGEMFPRGMMVHPDYMKDAVGPFGLMNVTSFWDLGEPEHPYSLKRLTEDDDGAWRWMPTMCNHHASKGTGALDEAMVNNIKNVTKSVKDHIRRLIGIARSAPINYDIVEKALAQDFEDLGISAADVNKKKMHWFRFISVWMSELEGDEGEDSTRWRGNWEQLIKDSKDVFHQVYSLKWRTTSMRGPAGLENKSHQWCVPRLHFAKAGVEELAAEIIIGDNDRLCLYGGMRRALMAFKKNKHEQEWGPHKQDVLNFLQTMWWLGEVALAHAAMMYIELPTGPLFTQRNAPQALKSAKFQEFARKLFKYHDEYRRVLSEEDVIAKANSEVKAAYNMFQHHLKTLRQEIADKDQAEAETRAELKEVMSEMKELVKQWAAEHNCLGKTPKSSRKKTSPDLAARAATATGCASGAAECAGGAAAGEEAVDQDLSFVVGNHLRTMQELQAHMKVLDEQKMELPSGRPASVIAELLKTKKYEKQTIAKMRKALNKASGWMNDDSEQAVEWLEGIRQR